MAIFLKGSVAEKQGVSGYPNPYNLGSGNLSYRPIGDAGGLTQFGAHLETLHPGGQSSQMHWETDEDEFLYMLTGALTVIEYGQPTIIGPGDACVWKAGVEVGHCLKNHTDAPATYLIVGARSPKNKAYYPGIDLVATGEGFTHLDGTPYPKFEG